MEVFSLLKFWRNAGGTEPSAGDVFPDADSTNSSNDDSESDQDSFFDLVFTAPDCDAKIEKNSPPTVNVTNNNDGDCHYRVFSKLDSEIQTTQKSNFFESPLDDFYRKSSKPQSPISILRSAPKFRVFMLKGFSKPKLEKTQETCVSMAATPDHRQQKTSKRFTVKYEVEEVRISSLLKRDNSLRSKLKTERCDDVASIDEPSKRFSKDVVQKYLNLIKPKRYSEKMRFPEQSSTVTPLSSPATAPVFSPRKHVLEKQGSRAAAFREVCKNLGKSRSASSAVRTIPPTPAGRRDDSVFQQQDGIESAILHCKRSYNSSLQDCSVLSRSGSAPCHGNSTNQPRNSIEEKRSSI